MSSAGTVTGKGFVIAYSVQSNYYYGGLNTDYQCRGGYTVNIDGAIIATCSNESRGSGANVTASGVHKFFTSSVILQFTTGKSIDGVTSTGSGNIKYICV